MFLIEDDSVIGRSLKLYGEWAEHEIDVLSSFVSKPTSIIDVGANIGTHTLAFASRFPDATVYAFEPQPVPFQVLCANIITNGRKNIRALNFGCARRRRTVWGSVDYEGLERNSGAFSLARFSRGRNSQHSYPISIIPLDRVAFHAGVELIKIDVEGMESEVLRGARETINRYRPTVYFEMLSVDPLKCCVDAFEGLDYKLYWLETHPYNNRNYNALSENVWYRSEIGILAVAGERRIDPVLEPVTGFESELPCRLDARTGHGMCATRDKEIEVVSDMMDVGQEVNGANQPCQVD